MKQLTMIGVLVFFLTALMVPGPAMAQKTLKLGLGDPIDSDQGVLALRFKEIVEKTSNGEYKVDLSLQANWATSRRCSRMSAGAPLTVPWLPSTT
ncbi:hypothetical protein HRM2_03180 [Desulforapulum autotrophicum HRM2]|uniref:Uncharacterized protein n=1 Tax=Desulforapulum autotrophicum (strain ATCC 43914 / DSM 3382 / VKM B-1955 / HRM2) TaxID=177437 RepID=C0QGG5_DESAH|nr:hypothetical protein [Desulforapulum autotrophicum]ACN13440.1 hypothetical protein HRM2_03180 [Desulforapulum autotrophicum HRM2]